MSDKTGREFQSVGATTEYVLILVPSGHLFRVPLKEVPFCRK